MKKTLVGLGLLALINSAPCYAQNATWQPMDTAPRNGTVVEIKNSYGLKPWTGLFKWSKTQQVGGPLDGTKECDDSPSPYELWPPHRFFGIEWGGFTQTQWDSYVAQHCHDSEPRTITLDSPQWVGVGNQTGTSVGCSDERNCQWRKVE